MKLLAEVFDAAPGRLRPGKSDPGGNSQVLQLIGHIYDARLVPDVRDAAVCVKFPEQKSLEVVKLILLECNT